MPSQERAICSRWIESIDMMAVQTPGLCGFLFSRRIVRGLLAIAILRSSRLGRILLMWN